MGGPLRPGFEPVAIGPRAIHALAGQPHCSPCSPSRTEAMGEDHAETKDALRRRLRAARAALPPRAAAELGAAACARVHGLPAFRAARAVVAYAPIENEVDPGALVAAAAAAGKPVYYPRRTSVVSSSSRAVRRGSRPDGPPFPNRSTEHRFRLRPGRAS